MSPAHARALDSKTCCSLMSGFNVKEWPIRTCCAGHPRWAAPSLCLWTRQKKWCHGQGGNCWSQRSLRAIIALDRLARRCASPALPCPPDVEHTSPGEHRCPHSWPVAALGPAGFPPELRVPTCMVLKGVPSTPCPLQAAGATAGNWCGRDETLESSKMGKNAETVLSLRANTQMGQMEGRERPWEASFQGHRCHTGPPSWPRSHPMLKL